MSEDEILRIAINLEAENKKKFLKIQKELRIRNMTDVIRWLINWYHRKLEEGES